MRKIISICVAFGLCGVALADDGEISGVFVGVQGGFTNFALIDNTIDAIESRNVDRVKITPYFGANLGYQYNFEPFSQFLSLGLRGYVSYDFYGKREAFVDRNNSVTDIIYQSINVNADMLVNLFHYSDSVMGSGAIGVYFGFGLGYGFSAISGSGMEFERFKEDVNYNGFTMNLNLGVSASIFSNHRFEIGTKMPLVLPNYSYKPSAFKSIPTFDIKPTSVYIGYSYVF